MSAIKPDELYKLTIQAAEELMDLSNGLNDINVFTETLRFIEEDSITKPSNQNSLLDEILILAREPEYINPENSLPQQSVNTMFMAMQYGLNYITSSKANLQTRERLELSISALLSDFWLLDPELRAIDEKKGRLNLVEKDKLRNHPIKSAEMIGELDFTTVLDKKRIQLLVKQTHESIDGKGYPEGKPANLISYEAKVIQILDAYESMTHERPYRKGHLTPTKAIEALKIEADGHGFAGRMMSPKHLRQFMQCMPFYPRGTYLELSNGAIGEVTDYDSKNAMRPDLHIVYSPIKTTPYMNVDSDVQLSQRKEIKIMNEVSLKDVVDKLRWA